jgi:peptidoglycan/LPS O-acetylase OafA/YrhL
MENIIFGTYDYMDWISLPIIGVASHHKDILGVSWSLDVEMQFYIILPIIWFFLISKNSNRELLNIFIISIAISIIGWFAEFMLDIETAAAYLPLFLAGAIIYKLELKCGPLAAGASVLAFCLIGAILGYFPQTRMLIIGGADDASLTKFASMLWSMFLIPFVVFNVRQPSSSLDVHMGKISYSLYLIHWPIIVFLQQSLEKDLPDHIKIIFLTSIIPIAALFYFCFDMNFEKMRQKFMSLQFRKSINPT